MKAIRYILTVFAMVTIVWGAIWYFYGKTRVSATFDGAPLKGALVYVDGKWVGRTPYETRLNPGYHKIEVKPPQGYEPAQREFTLYMFSVALGTDFKASFDPQEIPDPGEDTSAIITEERRD